MGFVTPGFTFIIVLTGGTLGQSSVNPVTQNLLISVSALLLSCASASTSILRPTVWVVGVNSGAEDVVVETSVHSFRSTLAMWEVSDGLTSLTGVAGGFSFELTVVTP